MVRNPTHVIAEAGTNHGGDLRVAKSLVATAKEAGADSVKFQIINPAGLYLPAVWTEGRLIPNDVFMKRSAARLPDDDFRELVEHARHLGIPLSASVFDTASLELLLEADPPYIKVASCDLNNYPFLSEIAGMRKKTVIATGMAIIPEIDTAVQTFVDAGNEDLVILHCVSTYPAQLRSMNLQAIPLLKDRFGFPVGLSDHTESPIAAAIAVALGATWIEKHFTYSRSAEGFDHHYAMEPEQLSELIATVRAVEDSLASAGEHISGEELDVRRRARRGLYAALDLDAGATLQLSDVLVVRPESECRPSDLPDLVGKVLQRPLRRYEALSHSHFAE